jgi:hypothetical protein
MFASIMITLSPSSTIALLADSRAKGDMSTALVGITVVADFVAMSSFSVLVTITSMECIGSGFDGIGVGVLFGVIAAALLCGLLMGGLLLFFLWVPRIPSQLRAVFIFAAGFGFAMFSNWLSEHSVTHWQRTVDVQPVLVCVIGSCVAGNESHNRRKFANILHRSAPYVFVPFFVYTGATLKMYALKSSAVTAIVLYFLRLFVLFAGSYVGGRFVDKTLTPAQYSNMWMAMTPSAGTALGLATQVQTLFSGWGTDFNLAVVSLVIINQVTGPALFKIAIRKVRHSFLSCTRIALARTRLTRARAALRWASQARPPSTPSAATCAKLRCSAAPLFPWRLRAASRSIAVAPPSSATASAICCTSRTSRLPPSPPRPRRPPSASQRPPARAPSTAPRPCARRCGSFSSASVCCAALRVSALRRADSIHAGRKRWP